MTTKLRVLSIDDNHQNLSLIQQALDDRYNVISSTGEESIIDLVCDCEPDIILLDIMLGRRSGYEVCRELRQLPQAQHIFILFVSSLNSPEDKLRAYSAGGDDYVCKPVDLEELVAKLEALEKRIHEQQALEHQMEEASQAAFASMKQSSELGLLMDFFTRSLSIDSFDGLFAATERVIGNFGFNCCVEFRTELTVNQYPKGHVTQLESEVLDLGKRGQRIVPFGRNVLFNARHCSLLVKKMPEDEHTLARIRDHLAIFVEIVNSRVQHLQSEENRQQDRHKAIDALKQGIETNFAQVSQGLSELEQKIDHSFMDLSHNLRSQLLIMGANAEQEAQISAVLDQTREKFDSIVETAVDIDNKIRDIDHLLNNLE